MTALQISAVAIVHAALHWLAHNEWWRARERVVQLTAASIVSVYGSPAVGVAVFTRLIEKPGYPYRPDAC